MTRRCMTIKQKLYLIGGIALTALVAIFVVTFTGIRLIEKAVSASENSLSAEVGMLQARRYEKNFIERRRLEYIDQVQHHVAQAQAQLEAIAARESDYGEKATEAGALLESYLEHFMSAAKAVETLGLDENKGLRGTLRDAVHQVEEAVSERNDNELLADMLMLRRREKDYIIRGDPEYLNKFEKDLGAMRADIQVSGTLDTVTKTRVNGLLDTYAEAFSAYVAEAEQLKKSRLSLSETTATLEPLLNELAAFFTNKASTLQNFLFNTMLIVESFAALFLIVGIVSTIRSIMRPLQSLQRCTHDVANGHHEACLEFSFTGELESLRHSVASMVTDLKNSMDKAQAQSDEAQRQTLHAQDAMQEAQTEKENVARLVEKMAGVAQRASIIAGNLAEAADELSSQAEAMSSGTELQQSRISETATAMEEMNATVLEVARNAASAAQGADSARDLATEGSQIVSDVVTASDEVMQITDTMKTSLSELGNQAEQIGAILSVISDIADQTNLLALNAAIEAARAGEEGRGFAVVADEVRKLAEKTMRATEEVGASIAGIQHGATTNIDSMDTAFAAVSRSSELANQAGEALKRILHTVVSTADQVRSIATAAEEQSAASEEINSATEEISGISRSTTQSVERSTEAIENVTALASELHEVIQELNEASR
ncbi:methyl-accepting chemotaxis protein [Oceanidesulfovibrio marinus]|uniref:Methyl-accepting chemotaxis protein n=2 Tax=Oceanidesulfovibrio marinus TaxID=370038 RepID=A0A6P1ZN80_9BACT|nr:methyl-accepting chemotaxis protein [Oceanidesulfovibrio marinus]